MKRSWVGLAGLVVCVLSSTVAVSPALSWERIKKDGAYFVRTYTDEFEGWTSDALYGNKLGGSSPSEKVDLNIMRVRETDTSSFKYQLIVCYQGHDWMFIQEGKSLLFLIDGKKMVFEGKGSQSSRDMSDGHVNELANYHDVDYDSLLLIANAKEVKVRIVGGKKDCDRFFNQQNFHIFKRFLTDYPLRLNVETKPDSLRKVKEGNKPDTSTLKGKKP